MASYTAAQLYGAGAVGENLPISTLKTFTFTNTGNSSYFVLETVQDNNGTFTNVPQACANGTWVAPASSGFIQTPFVASAVIQPGTTVITFTPSISITGTNYRLRGTGVFTLTIT
jgi:hypothetical protein